MTGRWVPLATLWTAVMLAGCAGDGAPSVAPATDPAPSDARPSASAVGSAAPATRPPPTSGPTVTLIAAGRIAGCDTDTAAATARVVDGLPGTVLTLGDHAYPSGSGRDFARCYDPSWGRFKARTRPVPGNHDHRIAGAQGYFDYFGQAAGTPPEGWYSFEAGSWLVLALDSECAAVGGCEPGSAQYDWLEEQLADSRHACVLAAWHRPLFGSGFRGGSAEMAAVAELLHGAGADIVLTGHDHHYERLAPVDAEGRPDELRGIRFFNVGTGGRAMEPYGKPPLPITDARDNTSHGVLELVLGDMGYGWRFVAADPQGSSDEGSGTCH